MTCANRYSPLLRVCVALLACMLLLACGGGGGNNTASTPQPPAPVAPPAPPEPPQPPATRVNCSQGASSTRGTAFTDSTGAPRCTAHLHAEIDNLKAAGTIPAGARGQAVIMDGLYTQEGGADDQGEQGEIRRISQQSTARINHWLTNGVDGQGNFYLTDPGHNRLSATGPESHGREVYASYKAVAPAGVVPSVIFTLAVFGTATAPKSGYHEQTMLDAYRAGRSANPLTKATGYTTPKAIFNVSAIGAYAQFLRMSSALQQTADFASISTVGLGLAEGLVQVGALGNSEATWGSGVLQQPETLLFKDDFEDALPASLGSYAVDDRNNEEDEVLLKIEFTDLLANASTASLRALIDYDAAQRTTPAANIASAFPSATAAQRSLLTAAGNTRLALKSFFQNPDHTINSYSLLKLLAQSIVHARSGNYYGATYLKNSARLADPSTHELDTKSPCGVLIDACFVLPSFRSPVGNFDGTSFAAPRLTAMIDTVWLIWPHLTNAKMLALLQRCTKDLGASGPDTTFGQGLLDFDCVAQPSGGVMVRTAQVQGVRGALYGASIASATLTTHDAFDRDFSYAVVHRSLQRTAGFDPLQGALVHRAGSLLKVAANTQTTSAWLTAQARGNVNLGFGATYEADSLFGMRGSGHFAIADGRSLGVRMEWRQPLRNAWNMNLSLAHYEGTASAEHSGAVSDLALSQSNASLTFERRFAKNSGAHVKVACSSGNSGSFNSFGTRIELFGAASCYRTVGAEIRF